MAENNLDGSELVPLESGGMYVRADSLSTLPPETRIPLTDGGLYIKVGEIIGTGGYAEISQDYRRIPLMSGRQDAAAYLFQEWD